MTDISTRKFLSELKKEIERQGGFKEAAIYFEVTESFVRSVANGVNLPGKKILIKMGYKHLKSIKYRYVPVGG